MEALMRKGTPILVLAVIAISGVCCRGYAAVTTARSTLQVTIRPAAVLSFSEHTEPGFGMDVRSRSDSHDVTTDDAARDGRFTDDFGMDGGARDGAVHINLASGSNLALTAKVLAGAADTAALGAVPGDNLIGVAVPLSASSPRDDPALTGCASVTYILTTP